MLRYRQIVKKWMGVDMTYLVKSSFWLNMEKVWRIMSELGILILLTRLTNKTVVGQYELIVSIYSLVAVLAMTGFNGSLLRALARGYDGTLQAVQRLSWRWSIVGTIGLALTGWWCISFANKGVGLGLLGAAPIFPWYTVLRRWDVVLQAKEKFAERSIYYALSSVGLLLAGLMMVWWNRENVALLFVVLVITQSLFNIVFFRRVKRLLVNNKVEEGWMKSGYKLFLSEIFGVMYSRVDRLALAGWLGLEALAIYAIATKIGEGVKLVLGGVVSAYVPRIYKKGTIAVVYWYRAQVWKLVSLATVGMVMLWLATPYLVILLFGDQYRESVAYAQWYLWVIPGHLIASMWGYLLIKERRELLFVLIGIIAGVANLVVYIVTIPVWGINGAVAGSVVYYVVLGGFYVGSVYWLLKKKLVSNIIE